MSFVEVATIAKNALSRALLGLQIKAQLFVCRCGFLDILLKLLYYFLMCLVFRGKLVLELV